MGTSIGGGEVREVGRSQIIRSLSGQVEELVRILCQISREPLEDIKQGGDMIGVLERPL